ncbi:hypothetical protein AND_008221 [Anopheles darlingi]|uniref:Uncharacterized protein n=1 Tax=Anopheles darlingi TaxID=43151 RepID=W5JBI0_ANODA|nr:hypothetical protein AND_008221 [Anopheles darlingi]
MVTVTPATVRRRTSSDLLRDQDLVAFSSLRDLQEGSPVPVILKTHFRCSDAPRDQVSEKSNPGAQKKCVCGAVVKSGFWFANGNTRNRSRS